jgi:hypothetical protein
LFIFTARTTTHVAFLFTYIISIIVFSWCGPTINRVKTGAGIGFYPTGTEPGIGYRSGKNTRFATDIRMARANIFTNPNKGSWVNEASFIYRCLKLEKIRVHIGLGARADWTLVKGEQNRFGAVLPIGIEAFPFPFQIGGLFFEIAPFATTTNGTNWNVGLRAASGFVIYVPSKAKHEKT